MNLDFWQQLEAKESNYLQGASILVLLNASMNDLDQSKRQKVAQAMKNGVWKSKLKDFEYNYTRLHGIITGVNDLGEEADVKIKREIRITQSQKDL